MDRLKIAINGIKINNDQQYVIFISIIRSIVNQDVFKHYSTTLNYLNVTDLIDVMSALYDKKSGNQ